MLTILSIPALTSLYSPEKQKEREERGQWNLNLWCDAWHESQHPRRKLTSFLCLRFTNCSFKSICISALICLIWLCCSWQNSSLTIQLSPCTANSIMDIKLTLMVGSTRSMAAHCRGVRLLASSRITCSWRDTG